MSTPIPTDEPTPPADPADEAEFQQILRTLLNAGTKLVQDLVADPSISPADKAAPYDRIARAIRRTIALARHLAEHPAKRAATQAERRAHSRCRVIREVESAIETRAQAPEQAESLRDELDERLDDPEFDRDLATRPLEEIIRDLKRDLGLEPASPFQRHPRRTPADIRALNARAAARPQSPDPDPPAFEYQPGQTRPNALLDRYREAADG